MPVVAPLKRFKALSPKEIELTLDCMLRVCEALGNPLEKADIVRDDAFSDASVPFAAFNVPYLTLYAQ
jgi:enamine deaminase RidA (YjgF/YER057c/UK114 family)